MSDVTALLRFDLEKLQELHTAHLQQACNNHAALCKHMSSMSESLHRMQVPSQTSHFEAEDPQFESWCDTAVAPKGTIAAWRDDSAWQDPSCETAKTKESLARNNFPSFKLSSSGTPEAADLTAMRLSHVVKKQNDRDGGPRLREGYDHLFVIHEASSRKAYDSLHMTGDRKVSKSRQTIARSYDVAMGHDNLSWWKRLLMFIKHMPPMHPQGIRRLSWDVACLVLLSVDCVRIPMSLAWAQDGWNSGTQFEVAYSILGGVFWTMDLILAFSTAVYLDGELSYDRRDICKHYCRSWLIPDLMALITDLLVNVMNAQGNASATLSLFRLVRLMRLGKFRVIMASLQNVCSATGRTTLILGIAIFGILFAVLFTVHVLACCVFVLGRSMGNAGKSNWLDRYDITSEGTSIASQYMWCFLWIVTQFTPAPSAFQPQNPWEQLFVLLVIMITIPVMGAQVGRATATINQLNEKSAEQNKMTRELQGYFVLCATPLKLRMRMIGALRHVFHTKQGILKAPAALSLMPSSLLQEFHVASKMAKIRAHPLFDLLLSPRLGDGVVLDFVSAFETKSVAVEDVVFTEGSLSDALILTCSGVYELTSDSHSVGGGGTSGLFRQQTTFCEASLWMVLRHSTTMHTVETGELLLLKADNLCKALNSFPAEAVAVHEYAESFVQKIQSVMLDRSRDPDILEAQIAKDCVKTTQLFELIHGASYKVVSSHHNHSEPAWDASTENLFTRCPGGISPELEVHQCAAMLRELSPEGGIYQQVQHEDERKRSLLSVLSLYWLQGRYYENLVASQQGSKRLSEGTWQALQDFVDWAELSSDQCRAVAVYLVVRGLGKSRRFLRLCKPSSRQTPELATQYAIGNLTEFLPSVQELREETAALVVGITEISLDFNFAQFLQGENIPSSVVVLKDMLKNRDFATFKLYLVSQLAMMCGLTATRTLDGSAFLDEFNAQSLIMGLNSMRAIMEEAPEQVYWDYVKKRGYYLNMVMATPEDLAQARLLCLTRVMAIADCETLRFDWQRLNQDQRDTMTECLLLDGINMKSSIFKFLPLYLANVKGNPCLGLYHGFRGFVALLHRLSDHGLMSRVETNVMTVDIGALANVAKTIKAYSTLLACISLVEILWDHEHATANVVMTAQCWKVLTEGPASAKQR